ncbi:MAG: phosphatidylglycerol lysyltransferase domain-containing protein [Promicromonosporaceae bacterium]|nr:phosphatidylglycerol lysyltransferase domain-containing protein [Promicromonosporaceae bacterium]
MARPSQRSRIENAVILAVGLLAALGGLLAIAPLPTMERRLSDFLEVGRLLQLFVAGLLLTVLWNLYRRKAAAWAISVGALIVSLAVLLAQAGLHRHPAHLALALPTAAILVVLVAWRRDFSPPQARRSIEVAAACGALALACYVAAMVWGRPDHLETLFYLVMGAGAVVALGFALRPFLPVPLSSPADRQRARTLLRQYGQNNLSYLALEPDKTLFFTADPPGMVAYGVVRDTIVVAGDPVCAAGDLPAVLERFTRYAVGSAHSLFFLSVTEEARPAYDGVGYRTVKCGEEARFDLATYSIAGKGGAKIRANINHATKAHLTVHEYRVAEAREAGLDAEFNRVTAEWLSTKPSGELAFSVGGVGLDDPMDKRYFYATDADGVMQGFVVFVPFIDAGGRGYMADVTRRALSAPGGVTQKIIFEAFGAFRAEGVTWGSMGVAPLANVIEPGHRPSSVQRIMDFAYQNLGDVYGFKSLFEAKKRYNPSQWRPVYFAYLPKNLTPSMVYAAVRIQNPQGIGDFFRAFVRGRFARRALR